MQARAGKKVIRTAVVLGFDVGDQVDLPVEYLGGGR
jgi:hypothetical protein